MSSGLGPAARRSPQALPGAGAGRSGSGAPGAPGGAEPQLGAVGGGAAVTARQLQHQHQSGICIPIAAHPVPGRHRSGPAGGRTLPRVLGNPKGRPGSPLSSENNRLCLPHPTHFSLPVPAFVASRRQPVLAGGGLRADGGKSLELGFNRVQLLGLSLARPAPQALVLCALCGWLLCVLTLWDPEHPACGHQREAAPVLPR